MSRDVRRVPLDFAWPLYRTWEGFLMPDEMRTPRCPECTGTGWSPGGRWLQHIAHRLGMLVDDALVREPDGKAIHPWLAEGYAPTVEEFRPVTDHERADAVRVIAEAESRGEGAHHLLYSAAKPGSVTRTGQRVVRPGPGITELVSGLMGPEAFGRALGGVFGWSGDYALSEAIREKAGLGEDWEKCPACVGKGHLPDPEKEAAAEAWQPTDPPTGEGWQLWESVGDGSPVSPVYPDLESFVTWLVDVYPHSRYGSGVSWTREEARRFAERGSSFGSFVRVDGGDLVSGEVAAGRAES